MGDRPEGFVVRIDPKTRRVEIAYLSVALGVFVCLAALNVAGVIHNASPASTLIGITVIAITSIGGLILRVVRSRIVLYRDGLEVRKLLWSRRVTRSDIVARRFHPSSARSAAYHILITRDGGKINLPPYLENNATLRAWLSEIPLASKGGGALTRR